MNMSDGKSDGIVLMYAQDGIMYPVGLTQSQFDVLNISMGLILYKLHVFKDCPQGKLDVLI